MSGVLFIFGILIWKFSQTSWASNTIAVASTSGVQATGLSCIETFLLHCACVATFFLILLASEISQLNVKDL